MSKTITYNLGSVLRETGMKPDTLRAWERRYQLPQPERSAGGHRLYSQRDIEIIKWLLKKKEQGMRIGQATELWKQKIKAGEDPLLEDKFRQSFSARVDSNSQILALQERWLTACLEFEEKKAEEVTDRIFARFSPEKAYLDIFFPTLQTIGKLWYQGKVTSQQEHFASALLSRYLNGQINNTPSATRSEKVVVGCPPEEEHDLALLLLTFFLKRRGFEVVYLGRNTPVETFKESVMKVNPHLVILAAQQLTTAATLEQLVETLEETALPVAYSGRIFTQTPNTKKSISAHYLGSDYPQIFACIEKIIQGQKRAAPREHKMDKALYERFFTHQEEIHAYLKQYLIGKNFPNEHLQEAIHHLNKNVAAALFLGNLDLVLPELNWIKELLKNRALQGKLLNQFLEAYAVTLENVLGQDMALLIKWIRKKTR